MNLTFCLRALTFLTLIVSCSKSPQNDVPDTTGPNLQLEKVVLRTFSNSPYDIFEQSVFTFEGEPESLFYVIREDSIMQYNGVSEVTQSRTQFEMDITATRLTKINTTYRRKRNDDPWNTQNQGNYTLGIDYVIGDTTPRLLEFNTFNDPSPSAAPTGRWRAPRETISNNLDPVIYIGPEARYHGYRPDYILPANYHPDSDFLSSITSKDSAIMISYAPLREFYGDYTPPLVNYPFPKTDHVQTKLYYNADQNFLKTYLGVVSSMVGLAPDNMTTIPVPLLKRKIDFNTDPELGKMIDVLGGKNYCQNLRWLIPFHNPLKMRWYESLNSDDRRSGVDFIDRLKWFTTSSTDSIHDIGDGRYRLVRTNNTNSTLEHDSKGRIVRITRYENVRQLLPQAFDVTTKATLEFFYKE